MRMDVPPLVARVTVYLSLKFDCASRTVYDVAFMLLRKPG